MSEKTKTTASVEGSTTTTRPTFARKEVNIVPLEKLHVEEGFNIRQDMGDIEALAASFTQIRQRYEAGDTSVLHEIPAIRGHYDKAAGKYIITDGHRRTAAARIAGLPGLPFVPFSEKALDRLKAMATLNSGKPLNEIETGNLIVRLEEEFRSTNPEAKKGAISEFITSCLNISLPLYYNYKKLLEAPEDVQKAVAEGRFSATEVYKRVGKVSPEELSEMVAAAIKNRESSLEEMGEEKAAKRSTKASARDISNEPLEFSEMSFSQRLKEVKMALASKRETNEYASTLLFFIESIEESAHKSATNFVTSFMKNNPMKSA